MKLCNNNKCFFLSKTLPSFKQKREPEKNLKILFWNKKKREFIVLGNLIMSIHT